MQVVPVMSPLAVLCICWAKKTHDISRPVVATKSIAFAAYLHHISSKMLGPVDLIRRKLSQAASTRNRTVPDRLNMCTTRLDMTRLLPGRERQQGVDKVEEAI